MDQSPDIESIIIAFITTDLMAASPETIQTETNLFADGYLDSISSMKLIVHIEQELSIKIPPKDLLPKNFMTIGAMVRYLSERSRFDDQDIG